MRDLETKLHQLTSTTSSLQSDNERLRALLQRTQTENEVLKATASAASSPATHHHHHPPFFVDDPNSLSSSCSSTSSKNTISEDENVTTAGRSSPAKSLPSDPSPASSTTSPRSDTTSTIENASKPCKVTPHAAWEILQAHPLFVRGILDISLVCERLKQLAKSDDVTGGPMFDEGEVRAVVEEMGKDGDGDDVDDGSI